MKLLETNVKAQTAKNFKENYENSTLGFISEFMELTHSRVEIQFIKL